MTLLLTRVPIRILHQPIWFRYAYGRNCPLLATGFAQSTHSKLPQMRRESSWTNVIGSRTTEKWADLSNSPDPSWPRATARKASGPTKPSQRVARLLQDAQSRVIAPVRERRRHPPYARPEPPNCAMFGQTASRRPVGLRMPRPASGKRNVADRVPRSCRNRVRVRSHRPSTHPARAPTSFPLPDLPF